MLPLVMAGFEPISTSMVVDKLSLSHNRFPTFPYVQNDLKMAILAVCEVQTSAEFSFHVAEANFRSWMKLEQFLGWCTQIANTLACYK